MIILEIGFTNLHQLLKGLYIDMLPLCDNLTGIAKGIAGLGALLYVSYRVWESLARGEELDIFPMLRPFAIGLCIMFFPTLVIGTINGVMSPVVKGCHQILENQVFDMNKFQQLKDETEAKALSEIGFGFMASDEEFDREIQNMTLNPVDIAVFAGMNKLREQFTIRGIIIKCLREVLEFIFEVAALIIDTIRTFFLIVLTLLGPISFAFSVYDGFQHTLTHWLCRYLSVYLWLPIADLFGAILSRIQIITLQYDIDNNANLISQGLSDLTYLLFLAIGIVGYFSVPTVSTWVINCSGMGGFLRNINHTGSGAGKTAGAAAGMATGNPIGTIIH